MTSLPRPAGQPLGVRLLSATDACDYEFWEARLVNPGLLRGAVAVALHRLPLLAAPAGTGRRGGSMDQLDPVFAEVLARALQGLAGFDQVRFSGRVVCWGEPMPDGLSPAARLRFQGLREEPGHGTCIRPPAGHGGHDLGVGSWPPVPGSPPRRQPTPPRVVVEVGAAHAP